jgi:hypothetical protein
MKCRLCQSDDLKFFYDQGIKTSLSFTNAVNADWLTLI